MNIDIRIIWHVEHTKFTSLWLCPQISIHTFRLSITRQICIARHKIDNYYNSRLRGFTERTFYSTLQFLFDEWGNNNIQKIKDFIYTPLSNLFAITYSFTTNFMKVQRESETLWEEFALICHELHFHQKIQ